MSAAAPWGRPSPRLRRRKAVNLLMEALATVAALVYLAAILLAISLVVNLLAQVIVRRFEFQRTGGS